MATSLLSWRFLTVVLTRISLPMRLALDVEAPGVDAVAVAVLAVAGPSDDEVAVGVHRHGGLVLHVLRNLVHAELIADRHAELVVDAGVDAGVVGRPLAGPDDDEVAVGVHATEGWIWLPVVKVFTVNSMPLVWP